MKDTMLFFMAVQCRNCDEDIMYGPCLTTLEHEGVPVIPFDIAAQTSFRCDTCGASNYTGDFDVLTEDEI